MRKRKWFLSAGLLVFLLGGCGFKDIDKRFFVIAIGIDKGRTSAYEVTMRLAVPSPRVEPGESKFEMVSQEADSIAEAVRLMKSKVDKEFDFGHTKVIVIGKPYADSTELGRTLDWFFRRRDIQQISYLALGEPDAKSVVKVKPVSERLPGNALILALSSEGTESPYLVTEPLFDYYRRYRDAGLGVYLPIIKAQEEKFDITRAAIFRDGRKQLELPPDETSVMRQLMRGYPRFLVRAELKGKPFTFAAHQMTAKYRILTPRGGTPEIRYKVSVQGEFEESAVPLFDRPWGQIEKILAEQIKRQYTDLLLKFQKNQVDPIGFGLRYRAVRHKGDAEIKTWKALYPEIKFNVHVRVKIKGTGIIK